jgi:iron(III) transport system ATP-binding protein
MILNVQNLTHYFDNTKALDDISFKIEENSIISILGPSGCGKTTLIRLISGLEEIQNGKIYLHDNLVSYKKINLPPEERSISYVFQDFALFPHMTVLENISFAANSQKNKKLLTDQVISLAKIKNFLNKYPHQLSGGEQQRVALARSIAVQPKLLLLDEPFSDLNTSLKKEIIDDTLHLIKSLESSAIIVTHNAEEAMFISDQIIVINEGSIIQVGTPYDIFYNPKNSYVASLFGETNLYTTKVIDGYCITPIGKIKTSNFLSGQDVDIIIRPEALILSKEKSPLISEVNGVVVESKFIGNHAIVHMTVSNASGEKFHMHSKVPGDFLPEPASSVSIELDSRHIFIFSRI